MKSILLICILSLLATGCSIEVNNKDLTTPVSVSSPNPLGIKFSGGANEATGVTMDADFSIGPKDRQVSGSTLDAQFSISTNRPSL